MSAVNESIVREYLEALGFLVQQPRKYQVVARSKRPDEELDLVAFNPHASGKPPERGLWSATELRQVRAAVVGVRGWHTGVFSPAIINDSSEIFRFAAEDVVRQAERLVGAGPVVTILCVPALPAAPDAQRQSLQMLAERGIDGVLVFRTILLELAATIDANRLYEKSDILQVLRILKSHGLLQTAQLDLFKTRRRGANVQHSTSNIQRPTADVRDPSGGEPAGEPAE